MESIPFNEWINQRIIEIDDTIETYQRCVNSCKETISINTLTFKSMNDIDELDKQLALVRLSIYENVIKDILVPSKNNYLHLLESFKKEA